MDYEEDSPNLSGCGSKKSGLRAEVTMKGRKEPFMYLEEEDTPKDSGRHPVHALFYKHVNYVRTSAEGFAGEDVKMFLDGERIFHWTDDILSNHPEDLTWDRDTGQMFFEALRLGYDLAQKEKTSKVSKQSTDK